MIPTKQTLAVGVLLALLTGCAATSDDSQRDANRGLKTGAAGGALLGLALGVAAGDASLAAKGAMVGAAAGGVAGAAADYQNDREDYRNERGTKTLNINGLDGTHNAANNNEHTWDKLDRLVGEWQVKAWAIGGNEQPINAVGRATGRLIKTTEVKLHFSELIVNGDKHEQFGQANLSYTQDAGYLLATHFGHTDNQEIRYAGEKDLQNHKYNYYPLNAKGTVAVGAERQDSRVELRFVGQELFFVETFVKIEGEEVKIQSYQFTKLS